MSLSTDQGWGGVSPGIPAMPAAKVVALGREAVDRAANVVVISAAATLYVHPDTVVHRLERTGHVGGRKAANASDPIPLRRYEHDIAPKRWSDSDALTALIVDQHPLERRGLAAILREQIGVAEIYLADDADAGLTMARRRRPELAIVDVHLAASIPARELCAQLRAVLAEARIILMTASDRVTEIRDCLLAGANGCLLKDTPERDLAESIRAVLKGENVIDPKVAEKLVCALVSGAQGPGTQLTSREREVLDLLAEGCTNRQIADRLVLAEPTVKGHISRLFEKISATSRLGVVVQARRVGLL